MAPPHPGIHTLIGRRQHLPGQQFSLHADNSTAGYAVYDALTHLYVLPRTTASRAGLLLVYLHVSARRRSSVTVALECEYDADASAMRLACDGTNQEEVWDIALPPERGVIERRT